MRMRNQLSLAAAVGAAFLVLAITGSFFTSRQMNRTADEHAMSSGRSGDEKPNGLQEFQNDESARAPATAGSSPNSALPPPSR
jgi:hypothetical protein